jgi:hypothetical protein
MGLNAARARTLGSRFAVPHLLTLLRLCLCLCLCCASLLRLSRLLLLPAALRLCCCLAGLLLLATLRLKRCCTRLSSLLQAATATAKKVRNLVERGVKYVKIAAGCMALRLRNVRPHTAQKATPCNHVLLQVPCAAKCSHSNMHQLAV